MHAVTRFAPSPTGRLHLGHAYSALLAHDFARERDGTFLLRIEDIDPGRVRAEYVDGIIEDLLWLGLEWDGEMPYQSERLDVLRRGAGAAEGGGPALSLLLHPRRYRRQRRGAAGSGRAHLSRAPAGVSAEPDLSRPHAWRLDVAKAMARTGPLYWMDGHTEVQAEPGRFGDVVLARKDAPACYHLAVTIDDAAQGVTDVVRGRDLFAATDVHRLLQALLDLPTPAYHHHDLLTDAEGNRLAKRHGAPTLADLRAAGADPAALVEALRRGELPAGYSLDAGVRGARMKSILIILIVLAAARDPVRADQGRGRHGAGQGHYRPALAGADAETDHVPGDRDPARRRSAPGRERALRRGPGPAQQDLHAHRRCRRDRAGRRLARVQGEPRLRGDRRRRRGEQRDRRRIARGDRRKGARRCSAGSRTNCSISAPISPRPTASKARSASSRTRSPGSSARSTR